MNTHRIEVPNETNIFDIVTYAYNKNIDVWKGKEYD